MQVPLGLIFCFLFCFASIMPNAMGLALQRFSRNAGSASALIGAMQMVVGAVASALVSSFTRWNSLSDGLDDVRLRKYCTYTARQCDSFLHTF